MSTPTEAFALLVLPSVSLTQANNTETGVLALECVTVPHPGGGTGTERDVYLVLRLNATETPLDPDRIVQRIDGPNVRIYNFYASSTDPTEITLTFHLSPSNPPGHIEDLDTFEGILSQYHVELRGADHVNAHTSPSPLKAAVATTSSSPKGTVEIGKVSKDKDLRGHLVMVDESTGEVVGQVEDRFRITEDPTMHVQGHENDPVVIEVSEETGADSDAHALEAFVRIVQPEDQNWVTKGATVVRYVPNIMICLIYELTTALVKLYP